MIPQNLRDRRGMVAKKKSGAKKKPSSTARKPKPKKAPEQQTEE